MKRTDCPACGSERARTAFFAQDYLLGHPGRFREVRCRRCGLLYINPRPGPEDMGKFYEGSYAPHLKKPKPARRRSGIVKKLLEMRHSFSDLRTRLKKDAFTGNKGRILDIGCGAGAFIYRLKELGWKTTGVETDTNASEAARNLGLEVHTGSLQQAAFPPEHFDIITVLHVLEHLHAPQSFLAEVRRILKPGGLLYVEVPDLESFNFRVFGREWFHLDAPRHLASYHYRPLALLLRNNGFRIQKTRNLSGTVGLRGSIQYARRSQGHRPITWLDTKSAKRLLGIFTFILDIARFGDVIRIDAVKS